ncbi:NADH:flavin oxidoreductase [Chloroflexota bacterium]
MAGVFDPITIKGLTLKNRFVMPPMATHMATEKGEVTDRHIKHYVTRADGGVGLIIVEHTYIAEDGKWSHKQLGIYDDTLISGLKRLTQAIHHFDVKVILQITHAGSQATRIITGKQPAGPSNIPVSSNEEKPRPLTGIEIEDIVRSFQEASRRAIEAGFDGVEIHGAHGYLLSQFISPLVNQRSDEYGLDLEGRLRLPLMTIAAVRSKIGMDVPLFYRFGADDMVDGGLTFEEDKIIATRLEKAGVDVIDIAGGIGGMGHQFKEQGYFVPVAQAIKETVNIPVIGIGNITEAAYADRIVKEGKVDLVAVGRKLLSEPDFPNQAERELDA